MFENSRLSPRSFEVHAILCFLYRIMFQSLCSVFPRQQISPREETITVWVASICDPIIHWLQLSLQLKKNYEDKGREIPIRILEHKRLIRRKLSCPPEAVFHPQYSCKIPQSFSQGIRQYAFLSSARYVCGCLVWAIPKIHEKVLENVTWACGPRSGFMQRPVRKIRDNLPHQLSTS